MNPFDRLKDLQAENNAAGCEMAREAGRFARLASRHEDGTAPRAVAAFNLFQTPDEIAGRMVELMHHKAGPGARILEPSAGLGRIYRALRVAGVESFVSLVEQSPECIRELYEMTEDDEKTSLKQADFLEVKADDLGGRFDCVVMNPPFKMGRDIKHIMHAAEMLKPGGVLVSLCYNGKRQNAKLQPIVDSWEVLPAGSFKAEGTGADVALLTIKK